ncbi:MAG: helix-turn-helix domain-containing protein [Nitrospirae bacterium]|nr:helix-turn-helix domain-containing protein [Nitrospirota bacterium]
MLEWKKEPIFCKRIRLLRELRGLTQRALIPVGIKQSYLANLETGKIPNPSPEMIVNLAKGLGVTAEDLVSGTELEHTFTATELPVRAYCPNNVCPKLRLNQIDTGMLIPYRFSIERSQASKDKVYEAKFCPYCGKKLLIACPSCKEPILIEDPQQIHCMLCGKRIFEKLTEEQIKSVKGQI